MDHAEIEVALDTFHYSTFSTMLRRTFSDANFLFNNCTGIIIFTGFYFAARIYLFFIYKSSMARVLLNFDILYFVYIDKNVFVKQMCFG